MPQRKMYRRKKKVVQRKKLVVPRKRITSYTHRFVRNFDSGTISGNALYAPYLSGASFSLSQVPNASEFTSLFDMYKLTYVILKFYLTIDPSAQTATTATFPRIWLAADYDDATAPSTLDDLRQHARVRDTVLTPNRPVIFKVRPAIASTIYQTGVSSTYGPRWNAWIDCQNSSTPWYGLKWGLDDFTNTNYRLKIEGKMYFACKDVR